MCADEVSIRAGHGTGEGSMQSDEALLIERLLGGDADAGRRFVREYRPLIYRFLLRMTSSAQETEDLTQETFQEVWDSLAAFEGRSALRTWILRIARNVYRQWMRSRRPEVSDLEAVVDLPDGNAARDLAAVEVREVVATLPVSYREIAVLFYQERWRCEEIAEMLEMPVGTVKYRLHEVRSRLRRAFGFEDAGERGESE
jgi:RNA polymerase sigma-70 factor (ECF subfamily)